MTRPRTTRTGLLIVTALLAGLVLGLLTHRYYLLLPHNHALKSVMRVAKGAMHSDYGDRPLTLLQSWHVQTAEAISFLDPANAAWLIAFNRNNWNKADNVNFLFILTAIERLTPLDVRISSDCRPDLELADFRDFNAVHQNLQAVVTFPGPVPPLSVLRTFDASGFHPFLKPEIDGTRLIVRLPTHPVIVDDLAPSGEHPESLDQRGQVGHFHTLLALEIYAWAQKLDLAPALADRLITAYDPNSYRNHQLINTAAGYIEQKTGGIPGVPFAAAR